MTELSILICGVDTRVNTTYPVIYNYLNEQAKQFNGKVQVMSITDNRVMSVGEKRTWAIQMAHGNYVCFVDDDDMVSSDYVESIMNAIKSDTENCDVICFGAKRYVNGIFDKDVKYGIQYRKDSEDEKYYYRVPNHLMCFKKSTIINRPYPYTNFGEDAMWARSVFFDIKKQHTIDKVLYHYYFSPETTETQK